MSTPSNEIPFVPEGTLDPAAGLNLALDRIDSRLQAAVISMSLTAPPVSPSNGDMYIPAATATGDWAGEENNLARYVSDGAFWQFYAAGDQIRYVLNVDDGGFYKFIPDSGGGSWVLAAGLSDAPADGEPYVRRNSAWEVMPTLSVFDDSTAPVETEVTQITFLGMVLVNATTNGEVEVTIPDSAPADATILTVTDETADLPNSRRLLPGTNISFDDSVAGQRTLNASGGSSTAVYYTKVWRARASGLDVLGATAATVSGTQDTPAKAVGGAAMRSYISKRRSTTATTANAVAFFRSADVQDEAYVNATASGAAGLELYMRFGTPSVVAGERFFCGMITAGAIAGTADPSSLTNLIGIGKDGADTNYQFMHNDGSGAATKVDLGLAFAALKSFDLYLSVPRGGGSVEYRLVDLDTTTEYTGTVSTNLPATDAPVNWHLHCSVGAAAGTAVAVEFSEIGLRYAL
jgi:hypothetical protein